MSTHTTVGYEIDTQVQRRQCGDTVVYVTAIRVTTVTDHTDPAHRIETVTRDRVGDWALPIDEGDGE